MGQLRDVGLPRVLGKVTAVDEGRGGVDVHPVHWSTGYGRWTSRAVHSHVDGRP